MVQAVAVVVVLGLVATSAIQYYLFVAGFMAYGVYRAYKVEGPNESFLTVLRRRFQRPPLGAPDDVEN